MFARRVIDVRSEVWSAPLPYLDGPWNKLFLSISPVNLKLIEIEPNPGPPREAILT
jgi:hypothetical protein